MCLSLQSNRTYFTKRYKWVLVSYLKENGKRTNQKFEGLESVIVQHEIAQLNGKLCKEGGINE